MRASLVAATLLASSVLGSGHERWAHKSKAKRSSYTLQSYLQGQKLLNAFEFQVASQDNGGSAQCSSPLCPPSETLWGSHFLLLPADVSESDAKSADLIGIGSDEAVHLRVEETKSVSGQRKAIKLASTDTSYGVGDLIIFDIARQPQVCGVWPAIWMTGPVRIFNPKLRQLRSPPERVAACSSATTLTTFIFCLTIRIGHRVARWIFSRCVVLSSRDEKGVGDGTDVQAFARSMSHWKRPPACPFTLDPAAIWGMKHLLSQHHIARTLTSFNATSTSGYTGTQMLTGSSGLNCDANANSDQGCGIRSSQTNSTGQGINFNGGGVYAAEIASSGIKIWAFKRDAVPSDIISKSPDPSSWTTPDLYLAESGCSPISNYFKDLQLIINTDLCGDWAEGVWSDDLSYAGQVLPGSCASQTGYSTCAAYVAAEGQDFKHAYWKINSIATYKS
ncbi:hypothetical protein P7C70_g3323, partial [Phenoliferia sp. Uapishka_3]